MARGILNNSLANIKMEQRTKIQNLKERIHYWIEEERYSPDEDREIRARVQRDALCIQYKDLTGTCYTEEGEGK